MQAYAVIPKMQKIIIGIDPDSEAHGVAVYDEGSLSRLECLTLMQLFELIKFYKEVGAQTEQSIEIHIENVCGQNSAFKKKGIANQKAGTAINRSIGMCQQAQIEVERMAEWLEVKVVRHRISKSWKKDKSIFEKFTKWKGRSNEDTRSAAYFGFLGLKYRPVSEP